MSEFVYYRVFRTSSKDNCRFLEGEVIFLKPLI